MLVEIGIAEPETLADTLTPYPSAAGARFPGERWSLRFWSAPV
jgi:hypothetical protein